MILATLLILRHSQDMWISSTEGLRKWACETHRG